MAQESGISGPHLSMAFLCDRVLQEQSGVPSFIHVAERFTVRGTSPDMTPTLIQTNVVVSFKAGSLGSGKYKIKIRINKPNEGGILGENVAEVFFEGGQDHGVLFVAPTPIVVNEEGLYWIDVLFEEVLVTRIPMRVFYQRQPQMTHFPQQ